MTGADRAMVEYERAVRAMGFAEKLAASARLRELAWQVVASRVRQEHPTWTPDEVESQVCEVFLRGNA